MLAKIIDGTKMGRIVNFEEGTRKGYRLEQNIASAEYLNMTTFWKHVYTLTPHPLIPLIFQYLSLM